MKWAHVTYEVSKKHLTIVLPAFICLIQLPTIRKSLQEWKHDIREEVSRLK
jgi:hypothetical protein